MKVRPMKAGAIQISFWWLQETDTTSERAALELTVCPRWEVDDRDRQCQGS